MSRFHIAMLIGSLAIVAGERAGRADVLVSTTGGITLAGCRPTFDDGVVHRTLPMPLRFYDRTYAAVDVSTNGNQNLPGSCKRRLVVYLSRHRSGCWFWL
jgi:hypothetical protein